MLVFKLELLKFQVIIDSEISKDKSIGKTELPLLGCDFISLFIYMRVFFNEYILFGLMMFNDIYNR